MDVRICSNRIAVATAVALSAVSGMGADQVVNEVCDLADLTIGADTTQIYFNPNNGEESFTLSEDREIGVKTGVSAGYSRFDFTDGGHTLKLNGNWSQMGNGTAAFFKGGTWDFNSTGAFYFGRSGDIAFEGQRAVFDSVCISNAYQLSFGGNNSTVIVTNGSSLASSKDNPTYLASSVAQGALVATNMNMIISTGSRVCSWSTIITDGANNFADGTSESETYAGNAILVTGAGSYLGQAPGRTQRLYHGHVSSGNTLRYEGGAGGVFYQTEVGRSRDSKDNVLTIADGAAVTNTNSGAVGLVSGADRNRIEVLSGGEFCQSKDHNFIVGSGGSQNTFLVSNAVVSSAKSLLAGYEPGAFSNRVHVTGRDSRISFISEFPTLFGCGRWNEWIVENCNIDGRENPIAGQSGKDWRIMFSGQYNTPNVCASTNNSFVLRDSARFRSYEFLFPVSSKENLAVVGNCCTLDVSRVISVRGCGNTVSISNGLVRTQHMTIGSDGEDASGFEETANVLEFRGRASVLTSFIADAMFLKVYDGGIIRFCIPEGGYGTPSPMPIRNANTYLYNGALEFSGVEELARTMPQKELVYELTDSGFRAYDADGNENPESFYEAASAVLPSGCRVYLNELLHLCLKVRRAPKGTSIVIR